MKLYFIRHWRTEANLTGKMAKNYDEADIIADYPEGWDKKVGCHISESECSLLVSSFAKRCQQTCELVFGRKPDMRNDIVGEFDCAALGDRKFWEMTREEFEALVPLTPKQMEEKADHILRFADCLHGLCHENVIIMTHGMVIRYLYHYFTGNKGISAYDVINSKGFEFSNLDMLVYDTETHQVTVHRYDDKKMFC